MASKKGMTREQFGAYLIERRGTHGLSKLPEYAVWKQLRQRCLNPKNRQYPDYGGRGIAVCSEWGTFEGFLKDMGRRPSDLHMIERVDNDGPYSLKNCVWATRAVQNRNRRSTVFLTFAGKTMTQREWAIATGISDVILHRRLKAGWPVSRAVTQPVKPYFGRARASS